MKATRVNDNEYWIPGYEQEYSITKDGIVYSYKKKAKIELKFGLSGDKWKQYKVVSLHSNGKSRMFKIHRLIATIFIPNPNNYPIINHINNDQMDNSIENLEWCTQKHNIRHAWDLLKLKGSWVGKFGKDHPNSRAVIQLSLSLEYIAEYGSGLEAQRMTGILSTAISQVCNNGPSKTAGGFKWILKSNYKNENSN